MREFTVQLDSGVSQPLPKILVNGVLLDEALYAEELQYHQADNFKTVIQKAGQALVIRQLLINEAGDVAVDDEEEAIQKIIEENADFTEPSDAECNRYFENNRQRFKTEVLCEVDHILLAAPPDDIEEQNKAREKASAIIKQLQQAPERFPALAEEHSICPSKNTGGSLGQIGKGQTVPEFEEQLARLSEGIAEKPIGSRYGFHVVRINRKIEGRPLEYSMVAEKIRHYLTQRASQLSIQAFIQSLVEQADIEGMKVGFSDTNIVI
ncbi:MAG: peptidylprolyl isomerase [Gammaproteobacteria bacterium]|nr:MAG: peptidylprolyl isomerase [Gammaproteobacteria bacterium]RLA14744.1 MAG: peptidylprolyl isomerase [Gammaproteobacteria bacterium]